MRTIRLCPAPTQRPTTLRDAIARSLVELERTGRATRTTRPPLSRDALA